MSTLFLTHPSSLDHDTGPGHPESVARLEAVLEVLGGPDFADLLRADAPRGSVWDIKRVHEDAYIQSVFAAVPDQGYATLDADTVLCPQSGEAALYAVGAVCAAVDAVVEGHVDNAFVAVRPPGHHAERDKAMGFCIFNNVAIAAYHAREMDGVERVAVMDFDVHHGNGTQQAFWDDANMLYASTHQMPCYPGSGWERERGQFGTIVNAPILPGGGSDDFRDAMSFVLPALRDFRPDLLIVSAGFDAHRDDPLAEMMLTEDDFAWVTEQLMEIADKHCGGRLVSVLEGGYDLAALGRSVAVHVKTLMGT